MKNYIKLSNPRPFSILFMYIDRYPDYAADSIFNELDLDYKIRAEYENPEHPKYRTIIISVKRKQAKDFELAMEKLQNKMLILGEKDYAEASNTIIEMILEEGGKKTMLEKEALEEAEKIAQSFSGSYWNYRWIKNVAKIPELDDDFKPTGKTIEDVHYSLHEVYYDEKEKPFMWTEQPVKVWTENVTELLEFTKSMFDASMKHVLIIKNGKIKETKEYLPEKEILNERIKREMRRRHEKETRRN